MILDLLTYIMLRFFGHIILALVLLICTLIVKNNLSQLIVLLKSQRVMQKTGNPKPLDLPVLNLEPEKNEELSAEEFLETFGHPPLSEEPLEVKAPPKSPTQEESLSQKLLKAARGDRRE